MQNNYSDWLKSFEFDYISTYAPERKMTMAMARRVMQDTTQKLTNTIPEATCFWVTEPFKEKGYHIHIIYRLGEKSNHAYSALAKVWKGFKGHKRHKSYNGDKNWIKYILKMITRPDVDYDLFYRIEESPTIFKRVFNTIPSSHQLVMRTDLVGLYEQIDSIGTIRGYVIIKDASKDPSDEFEELFLDKYIIPTLELSHLKAWANTCAYQALASFLILILYGKNYNSEALTKELSHLAKKNWMPKDQSIIKLYK